MQALLAPRLDGKLADLAVWSTVTASFAVSANLLGPVKWETSSCRVLLHDVMMSRPPGWRRLCTRRLYSACLLWPSPDKPMASKVPLSVTTLYLHRPRRLKRDLAFLYPLKCCSSRNIQAIYVLESF